MVLAAAVARAEAPAEFPAWFRPVASFVQQHPHGALAAAAALLLLVFAAGFGLAWLFR
jgi:hypothetical protein